jgi:hypothetical protein
MRNDVFFKLSHASMKIGKTRREVVVMLLLRLMSDVEGFPGGFTLVRYQERDPLKRYRCFSISFKKDENEFFTDLRKLCKLSVSYLVAIAVERYLEEMLNEGQSRHNYTEFTHYAIGQRIDDGIICWEFYWGDPAGIPEGRTWTQIHRRTSAPVK